MRHFPFILILWVLIQVCCFFLQQVLEGKPIYVDCYGNLAPLTKGGQQLVFNFYAFKENRLPFSIKVKATAAIRSGDKALVI